MGGRRVEEEGERRAEEEAMVGRVVHTAVKRKKNRNDSNESEQKIKREDIKTGFKKHFIIYNTTLFHWEAPGSFNRLPHEGKYECRQCMEAKLSAILTPASQALLLFRLQS